MFLSTSPINEPSKVELDVGSVGLWKPYKAIKTARAVAAAPSEPINGKVICNMVIRCDRVIIPADFLIVQILLITLYRYTSCHKLVTISNY
jgi:hypothetical protein